MEAVATLSSRNCKEREMIGVGKMKQYANVLDRPLSKGKQEASLSAFAFLFSELVQYNQTQVDNIAELERRRVFVFLTEIREENISARTNLYS